MHKNHIYQLMHAIQNAILQESLSFHEKKHELKKKEYEEKDISKEYKEKDKEPFKQRETKVQERLRETS